MLLEFQVSSRILVQIFISFQRSDTVCNIYKFNVVSQTHINNLGIFLIYMALKVINCPINIV